MPNIRSMCSALTLVAVAATMLACTETPPPQVPLAASPAALADLAGEWRGEYWSAGTGRRGSIRFLVDAAAEGVAHGDVVMVAEPHGGQPPAGPVVETLAIRLVTVRGGLVTGALEPYRDPTCDCLVSNSFTGELRGDLIDGGFVSFGGAAHVPQSGRWRVARVRD
jgi:hypothetical protein